MELMVTVSIAAVLAGLAAPSIRDFLMRQRMTGIGDDFSATMMRARNQAANFNVCTTVCLSTNSTNAAPTCATSGTDWQQGWIAFVNPNCSGSVNKPDVNNIFLTRQSIGLDYLLQSGGGNRRVMFNALGNSTVNGTDNFSVIYQDITTQETKKFGYVICMDAMGRTRNIPEDKACNSY